MKLMVALSVVALASTFAAQAAEPLTPPIKLVSDQKAYNARTLDPAEQLTLGEFRQYKKAGTLPSRVDPTQIYMKKVGQLQAAVEKLRASQGVLDQLSDDGGASALRAALQPYFDLATVAKEIVETMKFVNARGVKADTQPLLRVAEESMNIGRTLQTLGKMMSEAQAASARAVDTLDTFTDWAPLKEGK